MASTVHGLTVVEGKPTFDNSVNQPNSAGKNDKVADDKKYSRNAHHKPKQAEPKSADLPCEMRFEPSPFNIVTLGIINDQRNDERDAQKKLAACSA